jgi:hypothetical protein
MNMDPVEDSFPGLAALPSPAPAVAPASGPKIYILSPLPGNWYEVDWYFYSPAADVTEGDYTALISFAAHYGQPLAIFNCPDLAAFQASYPLVIVCPFSEVPPSILLWGCELLSLSPAISSNGAPPTPRHNGLASPLAPLRSILSHSSQGSTRGFDPP